MEEFSDIDPTEFNKLPKDILEYIFQYLSYRDLLNFKEVLPKLEEICNSFLIKNTTHIEKDIHHCMEDLNKQINGSNLRFKQKRKLLRTFNILENLKQCVDLYITLKRPDIGSNLTYYLAEILDNSQKLINLVKTSPFDINKLHMNSMWMQSDITDTLNKIADANTAYIGVRIVDYLDLMLQVHYDINVTYNIKQNVCVIDGHYYLQHSKLLFYLPDIPFIKSCSERCIAEEEQCALMKYLALLVNVHNRLIIKSEQTKRDLELSRWELLSKKASNSKDTQTNNLWLTENEKYNYCRSYIKRNIIDYDNGLISETYSNCNDCNHEDSLQRIKCSIKLECRLEEAPLQIIKSFKRLKNEVLKIDSFMCNNNEEGFAQDKFEDIEDVYVFDLKLELNLSMKKPDILELHFNHSNRS